MMDWWKNRSKGVQYTIVIVVLLLVVGAASGGGSDKKDDNSPQKAAETVQTTEPEEPAATPTPAPDTGRMSDGEYRDFTAQYANFKEEARVYIDLLSSECAFILSGGETSAFLKCEEDAFDGVIGAFAVANDDWEKMDDDVAKTCRVRLKAAREGLNNYGDALVGTHNLAKRGEIDNDLAGNVVGTLLGKRFKSFEKRVATVRKDCSPT